MVALVVPTKFGNQTHALTCLNGSPVNLDQIVSIIRSTIKLLLQSRPVRSEQTLKSIYLLMQRVCAAALHWLVTMFKTVKE